MSSAPTIINIDYTKNHLIVSYDATKQHNGVNPQVKFKYFTDHLQSSTKDFGIRLPTLANPVIKWGFVDKNLAETDKELQSVEVWTFAIEDDGLTKLTSPNDNIYQFDVPENFVGENLETGFSDFMDDGASCYEIFDASIFIPSKLLGHILTSAFISACCIRETVLYRESNRPYFYILAHFVNCEAEKNF